MVNVLGISGSNRQGGNTSTLIQTALDSAEELGATTELIELAIMGWNATSWVPAIMMMN